jgi:type IV pilus assembly protein PilA
MGVMATASVNQAQPRREAATQRQGEAGFTLMELLVVMLIVAVLAAIAIPAFFNQTHKANDASAKSDAKTAQTAMEAYRTDHEGDYLGASPAALANIEGTLSGDVPPASSKNTLAVSASGGFVGNAGTDSYRITVTNADTGNRFWVDRSSPGLQALGCTTGGNGGCPTSGNWGG